MSGYLDKHNLFLEPQTSQYGNHMVMTNVHKKAKTKYINIDSKFRDEFYDNVYANKNADLQANQLSQSTFTITIPEPINEVTSLSVKTVELPMFFYNISFNLGNSYFKVTDSTGTETVITLTDNNYTIASLNTEITNKLTAASIVDLTITIGENAKSTITSGGSKFIVSFDVNSDGINDKSRFRSKFGYLVGFRNLNYTVESSSQTSEQLASLHSSKYLYLAVEDFCRNSQNSFLTPMSNSFIDKNVLARISLNYKDFPFGTILTANESNGRLISDNRNYNGTVDLQKLNVKLLDENGIPVILNGMEFSFCLELEHL